MAGLFRNQGTKLIQLQRWFDQSENRRQREEIQYKAQPIGGCNPFNRKQSTVKKWFDQSETRRQSIKSPEELDEPISEQ